MSSSCFIVLGTKPWAYHLLGTLALSCNPGPNNPSLKWLNISARVLAKEKKWMVNNKLLGKCN